MLTWERHVGGRYDTGVRDVVNLQAQGLRAKLLINVPNDHVMNTFLTSRGGGVCVIALWLMQYLDIALWLELLPQCRQTASCQFIQPQ